MIALRGARGAVRDEQMGMVDRSRKKNLTTPAIMRCRNWGKALVAWTSNPIEHYESLQEKTKPERLSKIGYRAFEYPSYSSHNRGL